MLVIWAVISTLASAIARAAGQLGGLVGDVLGRADHRHLTLGAHRDVVAGLGDLLDGLAGLHRGRGHLLGRAGDGGRRVADLTEHAGELVAHLVVGADAALGAGEHRVEGLAECSELLAEGGDERLGDRRGGDGEVALRHRGQAVAEADEAVLAEAVELDRQLVEAVVVAERRAQLLADQVVAQKGGLRLLEHRGRRSSFATRRCCASAPWRASAATPPRSTRSARSPTSSAAARRSHARCARSRTPTACAPPTRQLVVAGAGLPTGADGLAGEREQALEMSFCQHVVDASTTLAIPDVRLDVRMRDNPLLEHLDTIAYLGVPLVDRAGHVIGSLCAIEYRPRLWTPMRSGFWRVWHPPS
jgi:hypothetical protein